MTDVIDSNLSLQNDVECILMDCRRDRPHLFAAGVSDDALSKMADMVARQLGPLIGGRYVSHRYAMERMERPTASRIPVWRSNAWLTSRNV